MPMSAVCQYKTKLGVKIHTQLVKPCFSKTHQKFGLVNVLGFAVGILDFLGKDQIELEEENVSVFGLAYDLFWVPHLKAILHHDFTQRLIGDITA